MFEKVTHLINVMKQLIVYNVYTVKTQRRIYSSALTNADNITQKDITFHEQTTVKNAKRARSS